MTKDTMTSFNFKNMDVRVFTKNNVHWFVLNDVCEILEFHNPCDAFSILDEDKKNIFFISTISGSPKTMVINKKGLYRLVLRSRKPEAEQFNKWVKSEVLPSLNHKPILGNKDMLDNNSTTQQSMNNNPNVLIIANTTIRQDSEGRYCLNDCHKASGMGAEKRPSKWMATQSSQELVDELGVSPKMGLPVNIVKTGLNEDRGIYVVKELVYAYAM